MGDDGRKSLRGKSESTSALAAVTPDFVPKPIAWGPHSSPSDFYFYLCDYRNLAVDKLPHPRRFCRKLAQLHKSSVSKNGKFGFHVVTYNGNLPQENGWSDTWEDFFLEGMKHTFIVNMERAGPCQEFQNLIPGLLQKVIPRLLRPLETRGNSITPALVQIASLIDLGILITQLVL